MIHPMPGEDNLRFYGGELEGLRINATEPLITTDELKSEYPITEAGAETVRSSRVDVADILFREDVRRPMPPFDRLVVGGGPCSIHDVAGALTYADWLLDMRQEYGDYLEILMRFMMEKPRTIDGYKGMIRDPYIDESYDMNAGLRMARGLLVDIVDAGVPIVTEVLDTETPDMFSDLVTVGTIGARTTETQGLRQLASAASYIIGAKNNTAGNIEAAVQTVQAMRVPGVFPGSNGQNQRTIIHSDGNEHGFVILRGGSDGPNYRFGHIIETEDLLEKAGLPKVIGVDLNHKNSEGDYHRQVLVAEHLAATIGMLENTSIRFVMVESNLVEGKQPAGPLETLTFGQSITDGCVGLDDTRRIFDTLAEAVMLRRTMQS